MNLWSDTYSGVCLYFFLKKKKNLQLPYSSVQCQVFGERVNRGGGGRVWTGNTCKRYFYGHQKAIDRIENIIERDADLTNCMKNKCLKQSNGGGMFSSLSANYNGVLVGMFAWCKIRLLITVSNICL